MKKILSMILTLVIIACCESTVFAVDEYSFDLQYQGTIVKAMPKDAMVLLTGMNATAYTNVRIKVDVTGPAMPELLAKDSNGNEINITTIGYWGPPGGFAVGGNFTNQTPIKATFPEEGNYTIRLSLLDLANGDAIITSKSFDIQVFEDEITNTITNNVIEELPKTGTSIFDYLLYMATLALIISLVAIYVRARKSKV